MKKSFLAAIIAALAIAILAGCGQQPNTLADDAIVANEDATTNNNTEDTDATDTTNNGDIIVADTDDADALFALYRGEVERRISSDDDFISEKEVKWYADNGYVIGNREDGLVMRDETLYHEYREFYLPLIVTTPDGVDHMVYSWKSGDIIVDPSLSHTNSLGGLHLTYEESKALGEVEVLERDYTHETIYLPETGEVRTYQFGQPQDTNHAHGTYVGKSEWVGHLFRDGQDVFALQGDKFYPIAHGVKSVIEAGYKLNSDEWSQPLFLMADGSVKAYRISPTSTEPDSAEHLVAPQYEGGYR